MSKIFVSSAKDNLIKIWNVDHSQCLRTYSGHRGVVTGLEFLDCGNVIASTDGIIQIWDPEKKCTANSVGNRESRFKYTMYR